MRTASSGIFQHSQPKKMENCTCVLRNHINVSQTGMTKTLLFLNLRTYVNISSFDKIKVMFTYVKKDRVAIYVTDMSSF